MLSERGQILSLTTNVNKRASTLFYVFVNIQIDRLKVVHLDSI